MEVKMVLGKNNIGGNPMRKTAIKSEFMRIILSFNVTCVEFKRRR